jgi:uncharacterized membrane protein YebE (DUF533 family)
MELAVSKIHLQDKAQANSSRTLPILHNTSSMSLQKTHLQAQAAAAAAAAAMGKHTLRTTQKQQRRRTRRATAHFTAPLNMSSTEQQHMVMVRAMVTEAMAVHMGQHTSCSTEPQRR